MEYSQVVVDLEDFLVVCSHANPDNIMLAPALLGALKDSLKHIKYLEEQIKCIGRNDPWYTTGQPRP